MDDDAAHPHAGLFPCFATDGFFEGFGGLAEPREGAVEVGWPAALAAEEEVRVRGGEDGHDYGWVCGGGG